MIFSPFLNGSAPVAANYTGNNCMASTMTGADLNLTSITIAVLSQSRTVTNVAADENYKVSYSAP
jgi:hypothetical protein